jgi:phosphate-selective porin OprO/OprP
LWGESFELRGHLRLEEDVALAQQMDDLARSDGTDLRRARVGLGIRWGEDWVAHVAANLAHRASLRDLSAEYRGWPVRIDIGRFAEPFGLGESVGASNTLLAALPSPVALGPGYGFGMGFNFRGSSWGWAGGAFSHAAGPALSGRYPEDALTTRATWRPWIEEAGYLHLGLSLSGRRAQAGTGVQLFGSAESSLVHGMSPRSALIAATDRYDLRGAEAALRWSAMMVIGERIDARVGDGGPRWHGDYLEVAWCLTGEQRSYSTRYGTIGGISPNRPLDLDGPGAWEVAVRWSRTDLSDGGGDRGRVRSAGLNWYPTDDFRVSVAILRMHLDPAGLPSRDSTVGQLQVQLSL